MHRLALALISALVLAGCGPLAPENPMEASLPMVYGARVTDGKLKIWTGTPCAGTTSVRIGLASGAGDVETVMGTPTYPGRLTPGVQVDQLTVGEVPPGMTVNEPLPAGFDWSDADTLRLNLGGPKRSPGGQVTLDLETVKNESAQHDPDTYWFPEVGWLGPDQVAEQNGKTFLTLCTPDPTREELPALFGVRVTDGRLQIWTGSPCTQVTGVILTFQPGQADLVLDSSDKFGEEFQYLTIGGPYPGFRTVHDLPADFDWRTADSVLLRLRFDGDFWTKTTQLASVTAESAQQPADAYFFEGVGWLRPVQVVERRGKDFHTACSNR